MLQGRGKPRHGVSGRQGIRDAIESRVLRNVTKSRNRRFGIMQNGKH